MANTSTEEFLTISGFKVDIDGLQSCIYESVDGLGIDIEDIQYTENQNIILNRPGRASARDIVLRRRFHKDIELHAWMVDIKNGKKARKNGSILLLDDEGKTVCRYNFSNAWPKHWSGPSLSKNAHETDILVETIVLSVTDIELST